jgi:hypothetical protein
VYKQIRQGKSLAFMEESQYTLTLLVAICPTYDLYRQFFRASRV